MSGPAAYDHANDPSPDYVTVERTGDGFRVLHFPRANARPCCDVRVKIREADHRHEFGHDISALMRAHSLIEKKHGEARK